MERTRSPSPKPCPSGKESLMVCHRVKKLKSKLESTNDVFEALPAEFPGELVQVLRCSLDV